MGPMGWCDLPDQSGTNEANEAGPRKLRIIQARIMTNGNEAQNARRTQKLLKSGLDASGSVSKEWSQR
eukprot:6472558-Amphidinium_carterae.1